MEKRSAILCCTAAAAVSCILTAAVTLAAVESGVYQRQQSAVGQGVTQPLPRETEPAEEYEYVIGEYQGRLAVYRRDAGEPETVLDVFITLLREADAAKIREGGIRVRDRAEMMDRLEDFVR